MSYIGRKPGFGIRNRYYFTATAAQTTFSGADDNGQTLAYADSKYLDVFLNGVLLVAGTDYTATTLTSVTLSSGAAASDIIEIVAYDIFSVADTVSAKNGGTFGGNITIDSTGFLGLPSGTTAQRPGSPVAGMIRHNTDFDALETYDGTAWVFVGDQTAFFDADFLVIAGGGGATIGGGGAGGYKTSVGTNGGGAATESALTLSSATSYTVTVGAGGGVYTAGSNSVFATVTSNGGGRGSDGGDAGTLNGGSGGGGRNVAGGTGSQGFDGGSSSSSTSGAGGGGAGQVGSNSSGTTGAAGGNGIASTITGSSITRGGGGGGGGSGSGGAAGAGGGGAGSDQGGTSGTVNTGGGGGGGYNLGAGSGGSGVVIVRYPDDYTITNPGGGLTFSTATDAGFKVTTFTAGTGNIQFGI